MNRLALSVTTGLRVNRDSLLYTLDKAVFDVNGLRLVPGGV